MVEQPAQTGGRASHAGQDSARNGSLFRPPPNISRVTVDGVEVSRYYNLDSARVFDAETDTGHHYRVERVTPDGRKPRAWNVHEVGPEEQLTPIGSIAKYFMQEVRTNTRAATDMSLAATRAICGMRSRP